MSKFDKLRLLVLQGNADANILFADLCNLLTKLGFDERIRGSHHIFRKEGVEEMISLQSDGSKAKAYQVRQVRNIMVRYTLGGKK